MNKLPQDFADLLAELCEADVEFLLVGGWAVILYGHVRATDDMDIFVRASKTNSERVVAALEAFGAPLRAHGVTSGHFAKEGDAYRFGIAPLKVEVLTKISGVSFDEAPLYGQNKEAWHRWCFDRLGLADDLEVLEVGCGTGALWLENRDRLPRLRKVVVSDASDAMVREATASLADVVPSLAGSVTPAEQLPFADASFDPMMAM